MHRHLNVNGVPPGNQTIKIGHKLQFYCNNQYELQGPEEIECLKTGQWNAPFPTCAGMFTFSSVYFTHLFIYIHFYYLSLPLSFRQNLNFSLLVWCNKETSFVCEKAAGSKIKTAEKARELENQSADGEMCLVAPFDQSVVCSVLTLPFSIRSVC